MASVDDLVEWRMRALGLWAEIPGAGMTAAASSGEDRAVAVASHLLALQGQDWGSSRWALGIRAPGTVETDVLSAFDSGRIVRSWPMRGTIHVVPAEEIGWLQRATNHRVLPGAVKRREFLGLDDETLSRMVDIAVAQLEGGRSASRDELGAAWTAAGIGTAEKGVGPWRYHVVWWLCQNGIAVPGPVSDGPASADGGAGTTIPEPRLVLAEEWIGSPRRLAGDEALAELATRFARGRGPVGERDLAWWTGLTVREARRAIAAAAESLTRVEVEGAAYWAAPELLDAAPAAAAPAPSTASRPGAARPARGGPDPLLLPAFDEHLLGYTDRSAVLDAAHFERIVPGRNGMFRATVADGGRVTAIWTRKQLARRTRIEIEPLPGETVDLDGLRAPADAWAAFRSTEAELVLAGAG